jgi:hypothetical protein
MLPTEQAQAQARRLQGYLARQVAAAADSIAPQLLDYIGGDSEEAIDASIEVAKAKIAEILAGIRQTRARPPAVDPAFTANVREGISDNGVPDDIRGMPMAEYAKLRQRGRLGVQPKSMLDFLGGA